MTAGPSGMPLQGTTKPGLLGPGTSKMGTGTPLWPRSQAPGTLHLTPEEPCGPRLLYVRKDQPDILINEKAGSLFRHGSQFRDGDSRA